ncbi:putative signal peptide protein [Puccinia sorghi]|uniref:Putative signal peptide protein n=1 Tax=Puccinia sorghi TaxID=27349 RepID=A0A0L6VJD2_9BASI|nr:putative signal peptide protein [Puccinia sorghi]
MRVARLVCVKVLDNLFFSLIWMGRKDRELERRMALIQCPMQLPLGPTHLLRHVPAHPEKKKKKTPKHHSSLPKKTDCPERHCPDHSALSSELSCFRSLPAIASCPPCPWVAAPHLSFLVLSFILQTTQMYKHSSALLSDSVINTKKKLERKKNNYSWAPLSLMYSLVVLASVNCVFLCGRGWRMDSEREVRQATGPDVSPQKSWQLTFLSSFISMESMIGLQISQKKKDSKNTKKNFYSQKENDLIDHWNSSQGAFHKFFECVVVVYFYFSEALAVPCQAWQRVKNGSSPGWESQSPWTHCQATWAQTQPNSTSIESPFSLEMTGPQSSREEIPQLCEVICKERYSICPKCSKKTLTLEIVIFDQFVQKKKKKKVLPSCETCWNFNSSPQCFLIFHEIINIIVIQKKPDVCYFHLSPPQKGRQCVQIAML